MIRIFLILESILFVSAALLHFGFFVKGHEHAKARIAESIIALVLLAGLIYTFIRPDNLQTAALTVQGFALFGTLVGIFTIIVGIGPRTRMDIMLHITMILLLTGGILLAT